MKLTEGRAVGKQLSAFVEEFTSEVGRMERRPWGKQYGIWLGWEGERKSSEPRAQRVPGGNAPALQQFVHQSRWAHEALSPPGAAEWVGAKRPHLRGYLAAQERPALRRGGAWGKVANCQAIVTWHYRGAPLHFPLLGNSPYRFRTEIQYEAIVRDAGYREIYPFLHALDAREQLVAAQVPESPCFWPATVALEERGKPGERPRRFPRIADRHAQPLAAKAWRKQAEDGKFRWEKIPLA